MTAVADDRIHHRSRRARRRHGWRLALVAVLAGLFVFVIVYGSRKVERDAIQRMDPEARKVLYESTLHSAEAVCGRARVEPAFTERCYAQTEFLRSFPECDARCAELVQKHRPEPTR